jgi:hypothetical protein
MGKLEEIAKECEALQKEFDVLATKAKAFEGMIAGYVPIEFQVDGIIKDYKDSVQKSNGLTVMKPSVVKLLDTAAVKPTKAALLAAIKGVDDHLKEVTKTHTEAAKKDKTVKANLDKFTNVMKTLLVRLQKHDTVG